MLPPQKTNMDTKKWPCLQGHTFSKAHHSFSGVEAQCCVFLFSFGIPKAIILLELHRC